MLAPNMLVTNSVNDVVPKAKKWRFVCTMSLSFSALSVTASSGSVCIIYRRLYLPDNYFGTNFSDLHLSDPRQIHLACRTMFDIFWPLINMSIYILIQISRHLHTRRIVNELCDVSRPVNFRNMRGLLTHFQNGEWTPKCRSADAWVNW